MSSLSDVFLSLALFHDLVTIVVIAYSVLTLCDLESDYVNARSVVLYYVGQCNCNYSPSSPSLAIKLMTKKLCPN